MKRAATIAVVLLLTACGDVRDAWHDVRPAQYGSPEVPYAVPPPSPDEGERPLPSAAAPPKPTAAAPAPASYPACVSGKLIEKGSQCQTLRADDGKLYGLAGALKEFGPGENACACGYIPSDQFCSRGTTFMVRDIAATCAAIR